MPSDQEQPVPDSVDLPFNSLVNTEYTQKLHIQFSRSPGGGPTIRVPESIFFDNEQAREVAEQLGAGRDEEVKNLLRFAFGAGLLMGALGDVSRYREPALRELTRQAAHKMKVSQAARHKKQQFLEEYTAILQASPQIKKTAAQRQAAKRCGISWETGRQYLRKPRNGDR